MPCGADMNQIKITGKTRTVSWMNILHCLGLSQAGKFLFLLLQIIFFILVTAIIKTAIAIYGFLGTFLIMALICGAVFGIIKTYSFVNNRAAKSNLSMIDYINKHVIVIISGLFFSILFMKFFLEYFEDLSFYQASVVYLLIIIFISVDKWRRAANKS
jgi:hypothetical protein